MNDEKAKAAHTLYGHQSPSCHLGAAIAGLEEADRIAKALGVERTRLHGRLEQYAALAYQLTYGDPA